MRFQCLFLSLALTILTWTGAAGAAELRLGDPARQAIGFDTEHGTLTGWYVNGVNQISSGAASGFAATDEATGQRADFRPVEVRLDKDRLLYSGVCDELRLRLECVFTPGQGGTILADCELIDPTHQDRAVTVHFSAALQPGDWGYGNTWTNTVQGLEKVAPGGGANQADSFSGHNESQIPLGSFDNGTVNVALAHSLRKTRFFAYSGTVGTDGIAHLNLAVALGLSPDTANFPSRAGFQFAFLAGTGGDGIREAMSNYYAAFPECFVTRAPYGGWALWLGAGELAVARRCGMGYDQQEFDYSDPVTLIPKIRDAGLAAMQYSEPWGMWMPIRHEWLAEHTRAADSPRPVSAFRGYYVPVDTAAYRKELASDLNAQEASDRYPGLTRAVTAQALFHTAIESEDGEWVFHCYPMKDFPWTKSERRDWAGGFLLVNSSPALPHPNRYDIQLNQVEYVARQLETTGHRLDAVYLDSVVFGVGWSNYNFRREHWKYAQVPLTFARVNGKAVPALHNALSNAEFLAEFRRYCDEHKYAIFDNSWHPVIAYHIGYIDALGAGEHIAADLLNPADLRTFRFLANRKPISTQDYRLSFPETTAEQMDARLNRALMYGIYSGTSDRWTNPDVVKRLEQVLPHYAELLDTINRAGWEVLTRATADQAALVERWGATPATGLYFTVLNPAPETRRVTLTLEVRDYPGIVFTGATELADGAPVEFTVTPEQCRITLDIPDGRTRLIQLQGAIPAR